MPGCPSELLVEFPVTVFNVDAWLSYQSHCTGVSGESSRAGVFCKMTLEFLIMTNTKQLDTYFLPNAKSSTALFHLILPTTS